MRTIFTIAALALFIGGCSTIGTIPPQDTAVWGPEPQEIRLSEITAELGWSYEAGPGPYDYTMRSPQGDQVIFHIGDDIININGTRWRQERDAYENEVNDLTLPITTHNFICKHFRQHHLVHEPEGKSANGYELTPLQPVAVSAQPDPKFKPTSTELKGLTICVDAGHGAQDPGGAANDVQEKDVVLPVALKLQKLLMNASAEVIMTRVDDSYPDLDQRCNVANKARCDLFVSVHANIAPHSSDVTGFEVFYNATSQSGAACAQHIVNAMDKATTSPNRGAKEDPRGLRVLEKTRMTAVLVELGFLSNPFEARWLTKKDYQDKLAQAVFEGIVSHWKAGKAQVSR